MAEYPKAKLTSIPGRLISLKAGGVELFGIDFYPKLNLNRKVELFNHKGVTVATISPKGLRKLAKALECLADEAEPKPENEATRYLYAPWANSYYRVRPGKHMEILMRVTGKWEKAPGSDSSRYWLELREISETELPKGAGQC